MPIKSRLRAAVETGLRRLPVARSAYAERDALRTLVLSAEAKLAEATASLETQESRWRNFELEIARFLKGADPASRSRLFDAFAEVGLSDYHYIEENGGRFLVNAMDRFISRGLFISGNADFHKFEIAIGLLKEHKDIDKIDLLGDIGANIGSICVPAVKQGFAARAIAVEPHPTNCRLLRANIAINDLTNEIEIIERAASVADNDPLVMELSTDNWGDHRIFSSTGPGGLFGEEKREHFEVRSIRIDSLEGLRGSRDVMLWMDIQGYEGHALQGAPQLLAQRHPLVLEFWPYGMLRSDSFSALRSATAHYSGFFDLAKPMQPLRRMAELEDLFNETGTDGPFTDILVI